eukprot:TRINITY_DN49889_c0_g1_i1.p1 TRINITY_DN49889_c0_g1~~TRINITY_DN49889_c0_g1_i1.p1  ORF type:complete len:268 (+),score=28.38 TRINITY_DN49889_c0_g1_i1:109-804(+)
MPKPTIVDKGRGLDMHEAIGWEQRIVKEEGRLIRDMPSKRSRRRRHHSDGHSSRSNGRDAGTEHMPEDLQAICSFRIAEHSLMTMRPGQGPVRPHMRLVPEEKNAHWVPGKAKILEYKPVFGFEQRPIDTVTSGFGVSDTCSTVPAQAASHMSGWRQSPPPARTNNVDFSSTVEEHGATANTTNCAQVDWNQVKTPQFRRHKSKALPPTLSRLASAGRSAVSMPTLPQRPV